MPCYNHENLIKTALIGIANQTYDNYVVYVVDDKSTDKTPEVIKQFSEKYPDKLIPIFKQENEGTAFTLNAGLDKVEDDVKYIEIFCGDDLISPYRIEKRVKFFDAQKDNIGFLYDNFFLMQEIDNKAVIRVSEKIGQYDKDRLLIECYVNGNSMWRKDYGDVIGKFGYEGYTNEEKDGRPKGFYSHSEDYSHWLQLSEICDGKLLDVHPKFTWCYRKLKTSKSTMDLAGVYYCKYKVQELAMIRRGIIEV